MALTTTSYAILGLLAARPWSAYELANHWQVSNLRLLWPRAQSNLYKEPKRLVDEGLARVSTQPSPHRRGRSQTVYHITPRGRRVLTDWLSEPTEKMIGFESEALLKVVNADQGTLDDLKAQIDGLREAVIAEAVRVSSEYQAMLESGFALPERAHLGQLHWRFLHYFGQAFDLWAQEARMIINAWEDTQSSDAKLAEAQERVKEQLDELRKLLT